MTQQPESRPLSPQILTPDSDHHIDHYPRAIIMGSDGEERVSDMGDRHHPRPMSLLTALIQTSEHKNGQASASDGLSAQSSAPSTTFSSPKAPGHGILQQAKLGEPSSSSKLQRESNSGGSGTELDTVGLGLRAIETLNNHLEKVGERRERIEWADKVQTDQSAPPRPGVLKFAVASSQGIRQVDPSKAVRPYAHEQLLDDGYDTDDGYQEDEEDGYETDSTGGSSSPAIDPRYPFARSTNFEEGPRFIGSTHLPSKSQPPAPALLPPPSRRGRGHVRVDETAVPNGDQDKTCSRHRSPPPTRSRSGSHARSSVPSSPSKRPHSGRLSDAGPREGRAGSPMPTRLPSDDDEEDVGDSADEDVFADHQVGDASAAPGGWRSDDAVFYGPKARTVKPIVAADRRRRHSTGIANSTAVFIDSAEEGDETNDRSETAPTAMRDFLRRASEHIPGFRRIPSGGDATLSPNSTGSQGHVRAQTPCPPALDDTPATAHDMYMSDYGDPSGGLTHRLESALSVPTMPVSAPVSRSTSMKRPGHVHEEGQ